jgi:GNAT superfamily N-acetyltransferase
MGVRGDPARCWCQYFRVPHAEWRSNGNARNRELLRRDVCDSGTAPGVLVYADDEPVGWCAVWPKSAYPRLASSQVATAERDPTQGDPTQGDPRAAPGADDARVWSITCFVVRVGWRRRGVASALLEAAVEHARSSGASVVEGYPVDAGARSRVSSADLYHGVLEHFVAAGFTEVARPTPSRARVVLQL